jgi:hypothetical protein
VGHATHTAPLQQVVFVEHLRSDVVCNVVGHKLCDFLDCDQQPCLSLSRFAHDRVRSSAQYCARQLVPVGREREKKNTGVSEETGGADGGVTKKWRVILPTNMTQREFAIAWPKNTIVRIDCSEEELGV